MTNSTSKNNSRIIFAALVLSRIIIGVGIWWVFFAESDDRGATPVDTPTETDQNAQRRYISERVLLAGELQRRTGFGLSTHIFTDSDGNEFGARSESYNLSDYEGAAQIRGEIVDFERETPIILIEDILGGDDQTDGDLPEGNPNFTWIQDAGLGIDLSASSGYEITESDSEIRLIESTNPNDPLLTIQPFDCVPGDALQDCADLQDKFSRFGNESFTSAEGITFYNLTETNTWFMFDLPEKGYSLRSSNDNGVVGFADLIQIVNQDFFESFVDEYKGEYCRSLDSRLDAVQEITPSLIDTGLVEVVIDGASEEGTQATCTIYVVLGENNTVLRGSYDDGSVESAFEQEVIRAGDTSDTAIDSDTTDDTSDAEPNDDANQDVIVPQPNNTSDQESGSDTDAGADDDTGDDVVEPNPLPVTDSSVPQPASLDGRLQHSSVRGYDMYFSKQGVSYVGQILDTATSVGLTDASCAYKVNVIAYQNAENVTTNPDLAVFECTGTAPTPSQAQAAGLQLAGSTESSFFVVQTYSDSLGDIEVYVE